MSNIWINVDLDKIVANYREVTHKLANGARCMAVVKADAYGLGAVEVAKTLSDEGCEAFAVTHVHEGVILRKHGIRGLILLLGPVSEEEWPLVLEYDLQLTLSDPQAVPQLQRWLDEQQQTLEIQLEIDTGMGRTGIHPTRIQETIELLNQAPRLSVVGVYAHFARAAQRDREYTRTQYERFIQAVEALHQGGIKPLWKHVCNSAAFLDYPEWHHDFVRIGTLISGHYPSPAFKQAISVQDPWQAKSRIVHLERVPKGTFVGYQSIYRTKKATQLAVIPVGYVDGFGTVPMLIPQGFVDFLKIVVKNFLSLIGVYLGQEKITLKGQVIPVAGKIGMQLTVVDVGDLECQIGDEVNIPLRRTSASPMIVRHYWRNRNIITSRQLEEGFLRPQKEYVVES